MASIHRVDNDTMDTTASSSKHIEVEKPTENECKYILHLKSVANYPKCKTSITITLKYREPAPGLVELKDHSGVYLNADKLTVCKRMSSDTISMARMLTIEIFTTIALSRCSVTNTGAKAADSHEILVRHATYTLLEFVTIVTGHACYNTTLSIQKGINLKMQDMKRAGQRQLDEEQLKENLTAYDKNDLRWTLKHREPAVGLVELIKHSGVYVNAIKLADCKRLSKDLTTLVPMLLQEIFTMCALTACSVTDGRSRRKLCKLDGMGLDEHAITTMTKFVEEYGKEQGWKLDNNLSVQDSVRRSVSILRGLLVLPENKSRIFVLF